MSDGDYVSIALFDRANITGGLDFRAETKLMSFRTDLDAPSWKEVYALMLQGALTGITSGKLAPAVPVKRVKARILEIIRLAGGPTDLTVPTEDDLLKCGVRPTRYIFLHLFLVMTVIVGVPLLVLWTIW